MIDSTFPHFSWFLWVVGILFFFGAALPLFISPLRWGKWFGWQIPEHKDFCVYLGRCLGGVAIVFSLATFRAASKPDQHIETIEMMLSGAFLLLVVHVWGALRGTQPWQENLETLMYLAIVIYGGYLYVTLPGSAV